MSLFPEMSKTEALGLLAQKASVCTRCDLHITRTQVVFGDGNPESPLLIVGEGPGANEDATGKPFVGKAGKLLDECLRECGITRKHVYITNVVRCRPTLIEGSSVRNRAPSPDEILACSPWLEETIRIIQPKVILCLGAPASNSIIHKNFRMTMERGIWFESRYCKCVRASWHPSYIMRQHGEAFDTARKQLVSDIESSRLKVIEILKNR